MEDASPLHLLLSFLLISSLNIIHASTDSISRGQSLSGNQTIISNGGKFELGFFTPGNSSRYYIGIWYKNIPGQTVVWVANRVSPVSDPSTSRLALTSSGNLVLYGNRSNTPAWTTNTTSLAADSVVAVLLDTGNLVLRNRSSSSSGSYLWQSFDHPTDTWMPGGSLGVNKLTGEYQSLTCWKSSDDPAPGLFSQSMDHDGSNQYVLYWNGSEIYWTSGLWNGQYFSNVPGTKEKTVFNFSFVDNNERKFATYTMLDDSVLSREVMDPAGQLLQWLRMKSTQQWQTFTQPLRHCDVYSLCGPFGVCDEKSPSVCSCPDRFQPADARDWESNDWNSGCSRKSPLQCGDKDGFMEMSNVRLPANPQKLAPFKTAGGCQAACRSSCSCSGYAYVDGGCSVWGGELRNLQQLHDSDNGGETLFVRLLDADIPKPASSRHHTTAVVLGVVFSVIAIICIASGLGWIWYRRKKKARTRNQVQGSLIRFSYGDLQRMTKNFSDKLGSGGFGTVFKGTMPDSTAIAVKKLEGLRQGEKQFLAEVSTLGAIQHINLARLRGFCVDGSKRLLIYDYMPGGSLDSHLSRRSPTFLNWKTRYQIILGTAKGLAYLHEKCRECIVHCDVKPENILLDDTLCAKVSDFGMAKLIGRDISRVLTTMRGTVGYLAPEWISGLPITPKVDVYSFGMMLFELISGRRNMMHAEDGSLSFYPSWAAKKNNRRRCDEHTGRQVAGCCRC